MPNLIKVVEYKELVPIKHKKLITVSIPNGCLMDIPKDCGVNVIYEGSNA